jgi:uncharacterized protein (TIGR03067 family)
MKTFALLIAAALGSSVPLLADEAKPAVPPALLPWNGVWTPQACEYDGQQQLNGDSKNGIRVSIIGAEHRMYLITDAKEMMGRRLATSQLQVDDKAMTFVMTIQDGYRKGERVHGIYKIENDTLRMCYGPANKPRPTEFAAPKGSEVFNEVWARANTKK